MIKRAYLSFTDKISKTNIRPAAADHRHINSDDAQWQPVETLVLNILSIKLKYDSLS